ncbi:MAG: hypothetical protein ACRYGG_12235 [Janthinobacterium lividum]
MARLYTFNCFSCDEITTELVPYSPPDTSRELGNGKFTVDINAPAEDAYPVKTISCPKCSLPVIGHPEQQGKKVPSVYFNYMGDDD